MPDYRPHPSTYAVEVDLSGIPVFRVLTLNTLFKPPTEHRWNEIAAWIIAEVPDAIFLQECREEDGRNVASWLAAVLPGEWFVAFGGVDDDEGRRSGNAILSRWPIEHHEQFLLECDDVWPKILLHVRTAGTDLYCVHLTAALDGAAVREAQALRIDEVIRESSDPTSTLPPVLAGDFNTGPSAIAIAYLRGECSLTGRSTFYQDAWGVAGSGSGITWDHENPLVPPAYCFDARCDYVFVGTPKVAVGWSSGAREDIVPTGQVTAAKVVCDRSLTGHIASDHYGVVAEICWPDRPTSLGRLAEL